MVFIVSRLLLLKDADSDRFPQLHRLSIISAPVNASRIATDRNVRSKLSFRNDRIACSRISWAALRRVNWLFIKILQELLVWLKLSFVAQLELLFTYRVNHPTLHRHFLIPSSILTSVQSLVTVAYSGETHLRQLIWVTGGWLGAGDWGLGAG